MTRTGRPPISKHQIQLAVRATRDNTYREASRLTGLSIMQLRHARKKAMMIEVEPTLHPPGSEEKIAVLTERYANGQRLWHPGDATMGEAQQRERDEAEDDDLDDDDFGAGVFDDEEGE